jgi:hypothetical protein
MRFTSLVIELIRARPKLVVWLVIVLQAILWLLVSLLVYRSPPGDLATVIALGREYRVGTDLGPPLAFWLADIAFRAAGNHMFGVYVLAQICSISTFWTLYLLARATVGVQQAVLAVLLTMTVLAFSAPVLEFGPLVLARPIWALLLLHSWQLIGQNRRNAWFAWSIEAGLLLLTTSAAVFLLAFVVGFALVTTRGRRILMSFDALFALLVIGVLALPYLIWLIRADASVFPHWPAVADLGGRAVHGVELLGGLLLASMGIAIVSAFNSGWFDHVAGGAGIVLLMSGLAAIVACGDLIYLRRQQILRTVWAAIILAPAMGVIAATLFVPWTASGEVMTSLPTAEIGHFFDDSFERRTNRHLSAVSGDAQLATLISLSPARPHLFLAARPERTPWLNLDKFNQSGGVVVWRASDTDGTPPPAVAKLFPGITPEVPQTFDRIVNGRQPLLRIGWAIVRPKAP